MQSYCFFCVFVHVQRRVKNVCFDSIHVNTEVVPYDADSLRSYISPTIGPKYTIM